MKKHDGNSKKMAYIAAIRTGNEVVLRFLGRTIIKERIYLGTICFLDKDKMARLVKNE